MQPRWDTGIWLGIRDESGEVIIGTDKGVLKARALRRKIIDNERWNFDTFSSTKGTPWEPIPGQGEREIKANVDTHDAPIQRTQRQEDPTPDVRRVRINREDIDRIGMTPGCPGCEALSRGASARGHSETCRQRVEKT